MAEKKPPYEVTFDGKILVLTVYGAASIREDAKKEPFAYAPLDDDDPWEIQVLFNKSGKSATISSKRPASSRKK